MQLSSKITVVRNGLEVADGMVKNNTQTTGKAIQLILHGIRFVSKHLELLELELHRVQVNQCQFCVV